MSIFNTIDKRRIRIKNTRGGKNLNMKTGTHTDMILDSAQQNNLLFKMTYSFQLKHRKVTVSFSDTPGAQTLENALVKIVTRRIT